MDKSIATDVKDIYEKEWWSKDQGVLKISNNYSGQPTHPLDYIGFDCLNGGLEEILVLINKLNPSKQDRVLDIGCGLGGPARIMSKLKECFVHGIDISSEQVKSAEKLSKIINMEDKVKFSEISALDIHKINETFDKAYAIESLVHIKDKASVLSRIHEKMEKNGTLVVADYFIYKNYEPLSQLFPNDYYPWDPKNFEKLFQESGFEIVDIEDRSEQLSDSYEEFYRLFGEEKINLQDTINAVKWWTGTSYDASSYVRRFIGSVKFLLNRKQVSKEFLGLGYDNVLQFCMQQAIACRSGAVRYKMIIAKKL